MAHRFRESTGPTWLAKRVRFSLVAVALSLLIGAAGLALSGNWLVSAQSNDFDADAEDISLDPSTVYAGQSVNISARFQNLSPSTGPHGGEATFDVTVYVEPPTGTATRFSWDNEVFTLDQERTFSKSYTFASAGTYTVRAEIYDINGQQSGWNADNRFDQLTETFTISNPITVQIGAADYTVDEDDGKVETTVSISASPPEGLSVRFRTSDGTADAGDYSPKTILVSFPKDTTTLTQTVPVTIVNNNTVESTEAFSVRLERSLITPVFVSIPNDSATVTIEDDDEATVAFTTNTISAREDSGVQIGLEVETNPRSSCAVAYPFDAHFSYTDLHGTFSSTATIPSSMSYAECDRLRAFYIDEDNFAGIGVVTGPTVVEFTLDRVDSADTGVAERVTVGDPSVVTVTIQDQDAASVQWERSYALVREGDQYDDLCVVIPDHSASIGRVVTVHFSYSDPAGALSSPSTIPSSVTFSPGDQKACVNAFDLGDVPSPSRSVMFTLDSVTALAPEVAGRVQIQRGRSTMTLEVVDNDAVIPNRAPTVSRVSPSASSLTLETGDSRTFQASATDPDANITSYEWTVKGHGVGNSGTLTDTGDVTRTFRHTFSTAGNYPVKATFTDDEGATGSVSWSVNVQEPRPDPPPPPPTSNNAPTVTIASPVSPVHLETGETRTFTARATDDDNNLTTWKWVVDKHGVLTDGRESPEVSFASTGRILKSFRHTFPDDGTYTVTVTFTDSSGESDSDEWRVEVEDPPKVDDKSVTHTCGTDPATPTAGDEFTIVSEVTAGEDLDDVFVRFDFSDPVRGMYDRARAPENSSMDISAGDTVRLTAPAIVSHGGDGWILKCTVMREPGFFEGYINNNPRQFAVEERAVTVSPYSQNREESDAGKLKSCGRISTEGGKLGATFLRESIHREYTVNAYLYQGGERVWEGSAHKDAGALPGETTLVFAGQPELAGRIRSRL